VIAIVDDEASILKGLKRFLGASNFPTEIYESAEAFLARGDISEVGCIVLDINLGGMSGLELRRRLKAMRSTTPVIFMTGVGSASVAQQINDLGCAAFLHKPFSGKLLIDVINNVTNPTH
jgi:FixJ family two-component response regulator